MTTRLYSFLSSSNRPIFAMQINADESAIMLIIFHLYAASGLKYVNIFCNC